MGADLAPVTRTDPAQGDDRPATVVRRRRRTNLEIRAAVVVSLLQSGNYRRICAGAGLTPQHVARVLKGHKGASLHVAARIADAAGVSLDEMYAYIAASPSLNIRGRRTTADAAKAPVKANGAKANGAKGANGKTAKGAKGRRKAAKAKSSTT